MKVSVYIPCYNVQYFIKGCIEAIMKQTCRVDEILVIDDGCKDETIAIASKYPVRIIRHEKNRGLSAVRNTAFKNAAGDFVASLDTDCLPEPEWLEKMIQEFRDERVGGVGGKLLEKYSEKPADKWRSLNMPQHWGDTVMENPEFLFGSNNVFRKSAVADVGYYNEECGNNGEDYEISQRLKAKGYLLIYQPEALAYHLRKDKILSLYRTHWNWYRGWHTPDKLSNILFRLRHNFRTSRNRIFEDIRTKFYNIIPIDIFLSFYELFRDLGFWVRSGKCS